MPLHIPGNHCHPPNSLNATRGILRGFRDPKCGTHASKDGKCWQRPTSPHSQREDIPYELRCKIAHLQQLAPFLSGQSLRDILAEKSHNLKVATDYVLRLKGIYVQESRSLHLQPLRHQDVSDTHGRWDTTPLRDTAVAEPHVKPEAEDEDSEVKVEFDWDDPYFFVDDDAVEDPEPDRTRRCRPPARSRLNSKPKRKPKSAALSSARRKVRDRLTTTQTRGAENRHPPGHPARPSTSRTAPRSRQQRSTCKARPAKKRKRRASDVRDFIVDDSNSESDWSKSFEGTRSKASWAPESEGEGRVGSESGEDLSIDMENPWLIR